MLGAEIGRGYALLQLPFQIFAEASFFNGLFAATPACFQGLIAELAHPPCHCSLLLAPLKLSSSMLLSILLRADPIFF
jgi:hypothetical protein